MLCLNSVAFIYIYKYTYFNRREDNKEEQLSSYYKLLESRARYAGLLLDPTEGFGLRPMLFLPFGQKKGLLCCFGHFWCSVVTSVTFSSNILVTLNKKK